MNRSLAGIVAPLALVAAGSVLLLNTLGVLPWSLWGEIGRWWPIVLILLGVSILVENLMGRRRF
jgi:hypothetical protein